MTKDIIQNMVDPLKGRTTNTTSAIEGLKVVKIIERIYALRDKQDNNHLKKS